MKNTQDIDKLSHDFKHVATITGAHGIKGEVKIKTFILDAEEFNQLFVILKGDITENVKVKLKSANNDKIIIKIDGVDTRNAAEELKGKKLFINRNLLKELSEEEYYNIDLIALKVLLEDGSEYGAIKAVRNFGAGDLLEIEIGNKTTEYFPFTKQVVPEINFAKGYIILSKPEMI